MKSSWKTTLGGSLTALGLALMGAGALDWLPADHKKIMMELGFCLSVIGPFFTGIFARDNNVTSEDAGASATPTKPPGPLLPMLALSAFLASGLVLGSGCVTAVDKGSRALVTTVQTVDLAMKGWTTFDAMGKATPDQVLAVRAAYSKYQLAEAAAEHALIASMNAKDASVYTTAGAALSACQADLIALINSFTAGTPAKTPPPLPPGL